jgi:hypothetical protein
LAIGYFFAAIKPAPPAAASFVVNEITNSSAIFESWPTAAMMLRSKRK